MKQQRFFASDNASPVHPNVMQAMIEANTGHAISYGDDRWTDAAVAAIRRVFGEDTEAFFVYNGTGANVLGIQSVTRSYNAVLCSDVSHIDLDECGAVEASVGAKLLPVPTEQGKLTTAALEPLLHALGVEHHSQPSIVSVTQSTELGTVYTIEELSALCEFAHQRGLFVQMDGARIANAAAALDVSLSAVTREVGVDMLSFGATKNGLMFGEAVLFFQRALADGFRYIRKQGMQLASKMRFITSQFTAYLTDDLWLENARHANDMAKYLKNAVIDLPGVEIIYPVQANAVFVRLPPHVIELLQAERFFYVWDEAKAVARWMASWDTTREDIDEFVAALRRLL